jgi:hypothetical protein
MCSRIRYGARLRPFRTAPEARYCHAIPAPSWSNGTDCGAASDYNHIRPRGGEGYLLRRIIFRGGGLGKPAGRLFFFEIKEPKNFFL